MPVTLPSGRLRLATRLILTGSSPVANTMGIRRCRRLSRERCSVAASYDHGALTANQIGRQCRQPIKSIV